MERTGAPAALVPLQVGRIRQRAQDDRHLRAADLHREITALGYAGSYCPPGAAGRSCRKK